jgi:hypothetical protein
MTDTVTFTLAGRSHTAETLSVGQHLRLAEAAEAFFKVIDALDETFLKGGVKIDDVPAGVRQAYHRAASQAVFQHKMAEAAIILGDGVEPPVGKVEALRGRKVIEELFAACDRIRAISGLVREPEPDDTQPGNAAAGAD